MCQKYIYKKTDKPNKKQRKFDKMEKDSFFNPDLVRFENSKSMYFDTLEIANIDEISMNEVEFDGYESPAPDFGVKPEGIYYENKRIFVSKPESAYHIARILFNSNYGEKATKLNIYHVTSINNVAWLIDAFSTYDIRRKASIVIQKTDNRVLDIYFI